MPYMGQQFGFTHFILFLSVNVNAENLRYFSGLCQFPPVSVVGQRCFLEWSMLWNNEYITRNRNVSDGRRFLLLRGGAVARWRGGAVARWRGGAVARWRGGAVARWRGGAVARWRGGAVARWRGGAVARWRGGAVAGSLDPQSRERGLESWTPCRTLDKFVPSMLL